MKLLLDENFPLPLYHDLRATGYDVEHIIVLGQRGLPDAMIRQRLALEEIVFLTQDTEFEDLPAGLPCYSHHLPCPPKPSDPAPCRHLV